MNPLQVPQQGPYGMGGQFTGHLHLSQKPRLSGSPVKEPSFKVPLMESLAERCPITRVLLHSSVKIPSVQAPPPHTRFPSDGKGPSCREMPISGYPDTFLTYIPGSAVKKLPMRPPLQSLFREICSIPRAPFIQLSKSPVEEPSSRFPKWGPCGKRYPSPEPFLHILQGPQKGSPPSRFPSQSFHRERHSTSRAPFNHVSKSPVHEPNPGYPTEPP